YVCDRRHARGAARRDHERTRDRRGGRGDAHGPAGAERALHGEPGDRARRAPRGRGRAAGRVATREERARGGGAAPPRVLARARGTASRTPGRLKPVFSSALEEGRLTSV